MSDLVKLTIVEAKKALDKKEISATELTQAYIKEMQDKRNLNAYVEECADKALEQAKASDAVCCRKGRSFGRNPTRN